jgi:eukaryotic-like serine/threonine-protein kinase
LGAFFTTRVQFSEIGSSSAKINTGLRPMASPSPERSVTPFPERIGRYELLLPIGSGGMATVFLARASGVGGFERDVALKIIHAHLRADEESKLHLLDEARLAARIRHPNVVPVIEVGDDPFGVYLVMDYVEGDSLAGVMRITKGANERLPLRLVARILYDTLGGLHAAHELCNEAGKPLGLVHRDYTPQNILVGIDGISRLSDFSVAKAGDRAVRTRTGLVKGKIAYMSPEQARGHAVDRRCDVWAAGIVAWELIAWRRLHKKVDAVSTLLSVVTEVPPRLRSVDPEIPAALDDIVARALTMDVDARIPSALELRRQLDQAFRAAGGIAEPQEVGEFVQRIVGSRLQERRERIAEVRKLRVRMEEIARPSSPPSSPYGEISPDELAKGSDDEDSGERTKQEGVQRPRLPAPAAVAATSLEVPRVTESVHLGARIVPPLRWKPVAVGAGAVIALITALAVWRSAATPDAGGVAPESAAAPPPVATAVPAPKASAANVDEAPAPELGEAPALTKPASETAPPRGAESGRGSVASRGRGSPRRAPAEPEEPAKRAEPKSKAPTKLARDPYGENQ